MKYIAFTQYIYGLAAIVLFYMTYDKWTLDSDEKWLTLILGVVCVVLLFVRARFIRRMKERRGQ